MGKYFTQMTRLTTKYPVTSDIRLTTALGHWAPSNYSPFPPALETVFQAV